MRPGRERRPRVVLSTRAAIGRRLGAAAAGAVLGAGSLTACGPASPGASAPTTAAAPAASPATVAATTTTTTAAGKPAPVSSCPSSSVSATFDVQPPSGPQPADRVRAIVVLTDVAPRPCRLEGFVGIAALVGRSTESVPVVRVDQPGRPVDVVVDEGESAFAGAEWSSRSACPVASSYLLTPPGGTTSVPVDVDAPGGSAAPLNLCAGGFDVGPLEPTTEGTVAFPDSVGSGLPQCSPALLSGAMSALRGSAGMGTVAFRLVLTDDSPQACVTGGYVGLQLLDAAGAKLPTRALRQPSPAPSAITVEPGQAVAADLRFSPDVAGAGDHKSGSCQPAAARTAVIPPDETTSLAVAGPGQPVCEQGTIMLSALQPANAA